MSHPPQSISSSASSPPASQSSSSSSSAAPASRIKTLTLILIPVNFKEEADIIDSLKAIGCTWDKVRKGYVTEESKRSEVEVILNGDSNESKVDEDGNPILSPNKKPKAEPIPLTMWNHKKCCLLRGPTHPIKHLLGKGGLAGRWNGGLSGWIFTLKRRDEVILTLREAGKEVRDGGNFDPEMPNVIVEEGKGVKVAKAKRVKEKKEVKKKVVKKEVKRGDDSDEDSESESDDDRPVNKGAKKKKVVDSDADEDGLGLVGEMDEDDMYAHNILVGGRKRKAVDYGVMNGEDEDEGGGGGEEEEEDYFEK